VRLHKKGGKRHEMPAHHNLEAYLDAYIEAAGIREGGKTLLFRSAAAPVFICRVFSRKRLSFDLLIAWPL
jgi:hypothetical protein